MGCTYIIVLRNRYTSFINDLQITKRIQLFMEIFSPNKFVFKVTRTEN